MKIAAYCRVSTDHERQLDSLENQKEFFMEYARQNGHELVELYADEGISGTSLRRRTEFLRLMQDAEQGLFEMVVVKDISRFARNTVDFLQSIRTLKALKIDTLFLTANMKSLGESEFVLTVFSAMAQEESANLSKRVRFGKKINAQKGRVPQRIFGYDRMDNYTLAINPEEADTVREIFHLYLEEGCGSWTIAKRLNELQRPTKCQQAWDPRGVRRILKNPLYCGQLVNNKYEVEDYLTGRLVQLPKEQNLHHSRPEWAIITPEQYQQAQAEMRRRQKGRSGQSSRYSARYLFSTLLKCECCGRSFARKTYTYVNTRDFWKCSTNESYPSEHCENRVTVDEQVLIQSLQEYFSTLMTDREGFVQGIAAEIIQNKTSKRRPLRAGDIQAKQKRLAAKKKRWQEMYVNEIISIDELKVHIGEIDKELAVLEQSRSEAGLSAGSPQTDAEKIKSCQQEIEDLLNFKTIRNTDLRKIIDCIRVDSQGNIRILIQPADA